MNQDRERIEPPLEITHTRLGETHHITERSADGKTYYATGKDGFYNLEPVELHPCEPNPEHGERIDAARWESAQLALDRMRQLDDSVSWHAARNAATYGNEQELNPPLYPKLAGYWGFFYEA